MKPINKKITVIILVLLLALLGGGATFILNSLFHLDAYKDRIIDQVQSSINRKVLFEKGTFSFRFRPEFIFTHVRIKERENPADFITADRLTIRIALLPLIKGKMVLSAAVMERPRIAVYRDQRGAFNFSDLLRKEKDGGIQVSFRRLYIKDGEITYRDMYVSPKGVTLALRDTDFYIKRYARGKRNVFKLAATVMQRGKAGTVAIEGSAQMASKGRPFSEMELDAGVSARDIDVSPYWPYYSGYVPFHQIMGRLEMESRFKGKLSDFKSRGKMGFSGLRFDYPQVFHSVLLPRGVRFDYEMSLNPDEINVESLNFTLDGLNVKGSCAVRDLKSGDPIITAQARTSPFNLENFAQYIPYGIIVKDTADYIEQHIKGGIYRLDNGRLNGRVSQIAHMERGTNYNVLFINGRVEKGVVSYGPNHPAFNSIRGTLELRGKDFILRGMSGNFGASPLTLEGRITDYPLTTPCSYPFTMSMTPRQPELAWLLARVKGNRPDFRGETTLRMAGAGTTDNYALAGDWNLTSASYSYADIISKPAGRPNSLSFKGNVTKQGMSLNNLHFNLLPLVISFGASYSYGERERLSLDLRSNQFQVGEIAPLSPRYRRYQPTGKLQTALHGESAENGPADLRWYGRASLRSISFKPWESVGTVSNLNGVIDFKGNGLETSQMSAHIGRSAVTCKGVMTGFTKPEISLLFSSPSMDPADLGLRAPKQDFRLAKVQGDISLRENNLLVKSFSTQLNKTVVNLKGEVRNMDNPVAKMTLSSPYLEVEDIIPAVKMESIKKREIQPAPPSITLSLQVERGKAHGMDFEGLSGALFYEHNILYLHPLSFSAMGGKVSGAARIDFGSVGAPHYRISYDMEGLSAEVFIRTLGVEKQEITGAMGMQGELAAKGNNAEELKKTLLGSTKVHFEEGKLRKFAVLSKIFSILNFSQLFKFQLPDMVSGGMPYNRITATLSVKDGVISSDDLYVASDAINISMVGKINLVKGELDATIGVKPLQTVDKVLSHIPIVGWILTGKNRSFLTAYFEAKGKLEDPTVTAVPVQSMAKGVFNIFKRVFQLPAKLFTDTGEVIK